MGTTSAKAQSQTDLEEPIRVWNTSPAIRFGAVLVFFGLVWSLVAPSEPASSVIRTTDTLFDGLLFVGIACLLTGAVEQANWSVDETMSRFGRLPRLRFETRVFGNQHPSSPRRPIGYQPPREASTGSLAKELVVGFIWILPLLWILSQVWWGLTELWGTPSLGNPDWLFLTGVAVVVMGLHEAIHALVAVHYGCSVSAGVILPLAAYIRPSGALLSRRARISITLAPTVIITLLLTPVLFHVDGWLVTAAFVGLIFNTLGAVADFRGVWYLLKVPSDRLYYSPPNQNPSVFVYERLSQTPMPLLERGVLLLERLTQPLKVEQGTTPRR